MSKRYCLQPPESDVVGDIIDRATGRDALLVTIAFNSPHLIDSQLDLLDRNFRDSFTAVVADNSRTPSARQDIEAVCERRGASYLPLPPNPGHTPSFSHGMALNWVYHNLVRPAQTGYFGFLDHDVFPIRPVSYRAVLHNQRSYGHFQVAEGHRYYWPGLSFFSSDYFGSEGANFLPAMFGETYGDTGARNWWNHYRTMDMEAIESFTVRDVWADRPQREYVKLPADDDARLTHFLSNAMTLFDDDWVHLLNGSNWATVDMEWKMKQLAAYLARPHE